MHETGFVTSREHDIENMHDPGKNHWEVVRCILRYIKGTVDVG